jgi:ATP-dependent protease ClpP protease subunit
MSIFKRHKGQFSMAAVDRSAEILIYDTIGDDGWYGGVGSKDFLQQLTGLGDVDEITVRINSPGGNVFEGIAMQIDSLAASVATVIAMAGDTITISDSGMMMVHNASGFCMGEATDMRDMADLLDKIRAGTMLGAYARTGKTADELTAIMDAETWYTAQEAVDAGWADSITKVPAKTASARMQYDLSPYKHAPKKLSAAATNCTCPCTPCVDGDCAGCTDEDCDCEGCTCDQSAASAKSNKMAAEALLSQQQTATVAARARQIRLRLAELG